MTPFIGQGESVTGVLKAFHFPERLSVLLLLVFKFSLLVGRIGELSRIDC